MKLKIDLYSYAFAESSNNSRCYENLGCIEFTDDWYVK